MLKDTEAREARIAAMVARRSERPTPTGPRANPHWAAMRKLVGTHMGIDREVRASHKAFASMLIDAGVTPMEWASYEYNELAVIAAGADSITDRIIEAGWRIKTGPRGGLSLTKVAR